MFVSSLTVFVMADAAADHSRLRLLCPQWQGAGTESIRLFVEGDNLGALNLYATVPDAFTDDDESVGLLLAAHAAIAMKATRNDINLRAALVNRDLIGQAKGILMERLKSDQVEAFGLLSQASKRSNRKLIAIAEELTLTGDLRTTTW